MNDPKITDAISRSSVLESAELISWYHANQKGKMVPGASSSGEAYVEFNDVISLLKNATALDVAPVVHARWITHSDNVLGTSKECSNCSEEYFDEYDMCEVIRYCPNCGARMDAKED